MKTIVAAIFLSISTSCVAADKVVMLAYYGGSASPSGEHKRTIKPEVIKEGYGYPFRGSFERGYQLGCRHFVNHLPAGRQTEGSDKFFMDFDGFVEVDSEIEAGRLPTILKSSNYTFELQTFLNRYPDAVVVTYVGAIALDRDMVSLREVPSEWLQRALDSISPIIKAGNLDRNWIAFDAAVSGQKSQIGPDTPDTRVLDVGASSQDYAFMEWLERSGAHLVVEPIPWDTKQMSHLWRFDSFTMWSGFNNPWQKAARKSVPGRKFVMQTSAQRPTEIKTILAIPEVNGIVVHEVDLETAIKESESYR